jgi:MFS transporter, MHS family, shikimate and dehydroshikimate transport protein
MAERHSGTPQSLLPGHRLYNPICVSIVLVAGYEEPADHLIALNFGHGTMFGLQSTFLPELFGTPIRYTGASLGFQLAAALGGGLSPIVATILADYKGGTAGISVLLTILAVITVVAALFARETRNKSLIG